MEFGQWELEYVTCCLFVVDNLQLLVFFLILFFFTFYQSVFSKVIKVVKWTQGFDNMIYLFIIVYNHWTSIEKQIIHSHEFRKLKGMTYGREDG